MLSSSLYLVDKNIAVICFHLREIWQVKAFFALSATSMDKYHLKIKLNKYSVVENT